MMMQEYGDILLYLFSVFVEDQQVTEVSCCSKCDDLLQRETLPFVVLCTR